MKRWIFLISYLNLTACASTYDHAHEVRALQTDLSKTTALQLVRGVTEQAPNLCLLAGGGPSHSALLDRAKLLGMNGDIIRYSAQVTSSTIGGASVIGNTVSVSSWQSTTSMPFEINLTHLTKIRVYKTDKTQYYFCADPGSFVIQIYTDDTNTFGLNARSIALGLDSDQQDDVDKFIAALLVLSPNVGLIQGGGF